MATKMSVAFKKKLDAARKVSKVAATRAKEETFGSDFEDGRYQARAVSGVIEESQSSSRLQARVQFEIASGEYKGQLKYDFWGLEDEDQQVWAFRKITQLGYEADDLDSLMEALADLEQSQPLCLIDLRTKGDFQNVNIRKLLDEDDLEEEEEEEEEEDEEEEEEEEEDEEEEEEEEEDDEEEETDEDEDEEGEEEEEEDEEEDEDQDEEEEEEDDEEVELTTGMRVLLSQKGKKDSPATVRKIEKDGRVTIGIDAHTAMNKEGKVKPMTVDTTELSLLEEEEAPKAKSKAPVKKSPAPAKKKTATKATKKKVVKRK